MHLKGNVSFCHAVLKIMLIYYLKLSPLNFSKFLKPCLYVQSLGKEVPTNCYTVKIENGGKNANQLSIIFFFFGGNFSSLKILLILPKMYRC